MRFVRPLTSDISFKPTKRRAHSPARLFVSWYPLIRPGFSHPARLGGNNNFTPGFQTPAKAYGPDLILEIDGSGRIDAA
jgi:hypothetical protein